MPLAKKVIVGISLLIWLFLWGLQEPPRIRKSLEHFQIVMERSPDFLRARLCAYDQKSEDYFKVLEYLNAVVPVTERIQLVLPETSKGKFEFLREKGRYYLYPRNYGNNKDPADVVLVYGVKGFVIPEGYRKYKDFSDDKYVLVRTPAFSKKL